MSLHTRLWYPLTELLQAHLTLRKADHIFCLNLQDKAYLEKKYHLSSDSVSRIVPAADPAYLKAYDFRTYTSNERILVFGTWLTRKGAPDIVMAFSKLAGMYPKLKLLLMGVGFSNEYVASQFPISIRDRLEFVPPGSEAELASRMLTACVYWIPSTFEGTPQNMMEAMATGMPAIGTATCGMTDVIVDGANGFQIPVRSPQSLADATIRLLMTRSFGKNSGVKPIKMSLTTILGTNARCLCETHTANCPIEN